MKVLTVKEFAELVKGGVYNISSVDVYGIHISMMKAEITCSEEDNEITFFKSCTSGSSEINFNIDDCIEGISVDESDGTIIIEFSQYMADMEIRKAVL